MLNEIKHALANFVLRSAMDEETQRAMNRYKELLSACQALGWTFEDDEFPPTTDSLISHRQRGESSHHNGYTDKIVPTVCKWLRPGNIKVDEAGTNIDWVLISNLNSSDIRQGILRMNLRYIRLCCFLHEMITIRI